METSEGEKPPKSQDEDEESPNGAEMAQEFENPPEKVKTPKTVETVAKSVTGDDESPKKRSSSRRSNLSTTSTAGGSHSPLNPATVHLLSGDRLRLELKARGLRAEGTRQVMAVCLQVCDDILTKGFSEF